MRHFKLITILSIALFTSIPLTRFVMSNDSVISNLSTSNVQAYSEGDDYRRFYIIYELLVSATLESYSHGDLTGWTLSDGINGILERIQEVEAGVNVDAYTIAFNIRCETCKKRQANCFPQLIGRYVVNDDGTISYVG